MDYRNILSLIVGALLVGQGAYGAGVSFDIEFTDSTYQVTNSNTFSDLLTQHNQSNVALTTQVDALAGVDTKLYDASVKGDYSVLMSATLNIGVAGSYEFQIGADWGRGGGVAVFDTATNTLLHETVNATDIWWANNWNHADVISTTYDFTESQYTLMWLGFEGCCAGSSTIRFAFDGGVFQTLDTTNIAPQVVPVPVAVYLFASALIGLVVRRRSS